MAKQALRQCVANAIAAAQIASTTFAMAAMLGRHTGQLKMPRPGAYFPDAFSEGRSLGINLDRQHRAAPRLDYRQV